MIINLKTAESQVYGALIRALLAPCSRKPFTIQDRQNVECGYGILPACRHNDVGTLKVHMMTGKGYDERGVIGLGEPPVISPGAAISNAVANAIGIRVPNLPLTPDRVIAALQKGGNLA